MGCNYWRISSMHYLRNLSGIILLVILAMLSACGGGGGSDNEAETSTNCVLGSSKIGECKI
jgi:hypothetical protein